MRCETKLIKTIRANLMLGWLAAQYDSRIVLIVRHPGPVVESQLRLGGRDWDAQYLLDKYQRDERLLSALPADMRTAIGDLNRPSRALTWIWCVENVVARSLLEASTNVSVFAYEKLLTDPGAWADLTRALGLESIPDRATLRKPSQQAATVRGRTRFDGQAATAWRARLSKQDLADIEQMLERAGTTMRRIDQYHGLAPSNTAETITA